MNEEPSPLILVTIRSITSTLHQSLSRIEPMPTLASYLMDTTFNKKIEAYCSNNIIEMCHKCHVSSIQKPSRISLGMIAAKEGLFYHERKRMCSHPLNICFIHAFCLFEKNCLISSAPSFYTDELSYTTIIQQLHESY